MKKAIIYLRISSDRQIDNTSLDTQEEITRSYCKRELFDVIDIHKHEAVSAKETNEKRVAELLEFVKSKQGKFSLKYWLFTNWIGLQEARSNIIG